ncbi:Integrase [Dickeya dadantii 3937]|uniref:Integrase n=1 Tax=Dickeya dadantii (strain 3937) TaxID=198628 RepID=E0SB36_DICD3|nr:Integrase [Dickeya dadantii 3937]
MESLFQALTCSALIESCLWTEGIVELQMSHMEKNNVRAAYTFLNRIA